MDKFVELSNGAIFNLQDLLLLGRSDINQFQIFIKGLPQAAINAEGKDVDMIKDLLGLEVKNA